ncbi:MAG: trypsin-like peptidase domain-containing protein [Anaerolineae bacterium]|nr:trypsin-like peptidase domain-containing protein [Anaerolineae bacterium]
MALILIALLLTACNPSQTTPQSPITPVSTEQSISQSAAPTATLISATLIAEADAAQQVFANLYDRISPSVVNIEAIQRTAQTEQDTNGSGFIYDAEGHIVTNAHVVFNATEIYVTFNDGFVTSARVVGSDEFSDLAVIRVEVDASRLLPVTLGDSAALKVGQFIATIGNPFGLLSSMTTGIISATGRTLDSALMLVNSNANFSNPSVIQIDAQINPGNSGGPLLDINGNVIGINTAIRTESGAFQGIGFAVPVNTLKRVVPLLISAGKVTYSWLGIDSSAVFSVASVAQELRLPVDYGVLVTRVTEGSPAAEAGLRGGSQTMTIRGKTLLSGGDLIIALNDVRVESFEMLLIYLIENTSPGDNLKLTIIRDNNTFDVNVTLRERP